MTPVPETERRLRAEAGAVGLARELLEDVRPALGERDLFSARLLVSELVTNAVRHGPTADGSGTISVRLARQSDVLRVEVRDAGDGFVVRPRRQDQHRGSGWGLHFVSRMARRWGVEGGDGTLVWLELELDDGALMTDLDAPA